METARQIRIDIYAYESSVAYATLIHNNDWLREEIRLIRLYKDRDYGYKNTVEQSELEKITTRSKKESTYLLDAFKEIMR